MGTVTEKLEYLNETKSQIKDAIVAKGVEVAEDATFRDYATKIGEIETGGGNDYNCYFNPFDESTRSSATSVGNNLSSITQIDTSKWNTTGFTAAPYIFNNMGHLKSLDLSMWVTSSFQYINNLFSYCTSLEYLNLSNWDTSEVISIDNIFNYMASNTRSKFKIVGLESLKFPKLTTAQYAFYESGISGKLDLSGWGISSACTKLVRCFYGASSITELNLSNWDVSNVTSLYEIFGSTPSLKRLDLSGWNISNKCTNLQYAISAGSNLTSVGTLIADFSTWDVSNVTDMSYMFGYSRLTAELDLSSWNTQSLTSMNYMFISNIYLTSLNLSGWNISKLTSLSYVFNGCVNLQYLNLSGWDTSSVTSMTDLIRNTNTSPALTVIWGDNWASNKSLTTLSYQFIYTLTHDSCLDLFNKLADRSGESEYIIHTLSLYSGVYSQMSADEIKIATDKGWTVGV